MKVVALEYGTQLENGQSLKVQGVIGENETPEQAFFELRRFTNQTISAQDPQEAEAKAQAEKVETEMKRVAAILEMKEKLVELGISQEDAVIALSPPVVEETPVENVEEAQVAEVQSAE